MHDKVYLWKRLHKGRELKKLVTIRDVAKEAGVSVATVSRVINGSGYAHIDTKKAVELAVSKLQYKPNEVARSLYKRKSKLIGLILPDITNPFFPELSRGVEDYLQRRGYRLIIGNSDGKQEKEREYINTFSQNNIIGIIASTSEYNDRNYQDLNMPVVLLDRTTEDLPAVYADQHAGGKLAAAALMERGSKEITLVRGPITIKPVRERYQSALELLQDTEGVNVQVLDSTLSFEGAKSCAKELFDKYPKTDGVIACNDIVASAILQEGLRLGRRIPEDLQIIGYDDIPMCALLYPALSTISQPAYEMGEVAAESLIKMINKEPLIEQHIKLDVTFIDRQTTRKGM